KKKKKKKKKKKNRFFGRSFLLLFTNYRRAFKSFANSSKPGLPNKANMLRLLVKNFP
ncbi:hypothetical protein HMPREF9507_00626, partial [Enterococcus faecalis TX0309B]